MPMPKSISRRPRSVSPQSPGNSGKRRFLPRSAAPMPAASRARSAFELGLGLCVFLFLPLSALFSRGLAPLIAVAGLAAPAGVAAGRRVRMSALLFAALLSWGLVSLFWAVDPQRSLVMAARLL